MEKAAISAWVLIIGFVAFCSMVILYRLHIHPLSKFPGPKLAAATGLYAFYFNVIKNGVYIWKIQEMHDRYGPIIRIGPNELHINDPEFFPEIYAGNNRRREKTQRWARFVVTMPRSSGGTIEHDLHITRKKPLLKHFSMRSIREMEDRIRPSVDKFFCLLQQAEKSGTVFNLNTGFMALASDVISEYCYGFPLGYLDDPELKNSVRETLGTLLSFGHLLGYIPNALAIYNMLPKAFTTRFLSKVEELFETNDSVRARCVQALKQRNFSKPTIIESLEHESIPENERTPDRIGDECLLLLFAGTETSARVLSTIMYHLLSNLAIFSRLREEVIRVMPTPSHYPTLSDLESLPYLKAVINEGLRISLITINPLSLIAPDESLIYKEWIIPPGGMLNITTDGFSLIQTEVGESVYFVHMNQELFPHPHLFDPDRYSRARDVGVHLESFLVPFLKGARDCVGKNLAYAEMYIMLAILVRRFDLELYQTTVEDVAPQRDHIISKVRDGSQGVRVKVTKILTV